MQKRIYIDLETTGLDAKANGIIQIAGFIATGDPRNIVEFNMNVRPFETDIIEPKALETNGKTLEQIATYTPAKEAHKQFTALLGRFVDKFERDDKFLFIGYNSQFDAQFLREWFAKCGDNFYGSWFLNPPICIMNLAMYVLQEERNALPNFKLGTVAEYLGIKSEGELHDAQTDIRMTFGIERALRERILASTINPNF